MFQGVFSGIGLHLINCDLCAALAAYVHYMRYGSFLCNYGRVDSDSDSDYSDDGDGWQL